MAQNEKEQNDYRITYYNAVSSKEVDWLVMMVTRL